MRINLASLFILVPFLFIPCMKVGYQQSNPSVQTVFDERQSLLWNNYEQILVNRSAYDEVVEKFTYSNNHSPNIEYDPIISHRYEVNDSIRQQIQKNVILSDSLLDLVPDHVQVLLNDSGARIKYSSDYFFGINCLGFGAKEYLGQVEYSKLTESEPLNQSGTLKHVKGKYTLFIALHMYGHIYDYFLDKYFFGPMNKDNKEYNLFSKNEYNGENIGEVLSRDYKYQYAFIFLGDEKLTYRRSTKKYRQPREFFAQSFVHYYLSERGREYLFNEFPETFAIIKALEVTLFQLEGTS